MSRRTDLAGTRTVDYDEVAKVYDQVRAGDPEMMHQVLSEVLPGRKSIILDIGCGTANNTLLVSRITQDRVVGIDLSSGMLHEAKKKAPEIHLAHASATRSFRNSACEFKLHLLLGKIFIENTGNSLCFFSKFFCYF